MQTKKIEETVKVIELDHVIDIHAVALKYRQLIGVFSKDFPVKVRYKCNKKQNNIAFYFTGEKIEIDNLLCMLDSYCIELTI